jgi:uncharacterized caspase-like protein
VVPALLVSALAAPPCAAQTAAPAEERVALVIGNGAYRHVPPLTNPPNDARLVAETLKSLDFRLIGDVALLNGDRAAMEHAIRDFGKRLRGRAVGLFYYAGHGVQIEGENYLVPVAADVEDAADVKYELVNVGYVLDEMKNAGNRLNIVILDACRNNPFGGRGLRALTRGLAQMQAPEGTIISYATQPGATASDGSGKNSPFTRALTVAMVKPGLSVFETFNDVGLSVKAATGGQQQPWLASSPIEGTFQFRARAILPAPAALANAPVPAAAASTASSADDRTFWESVKDSNNVAELKAYLDRFPQGTFASLAALRIKQLRAAAGPAPATRHNTPGPNAAPMPGSAASGSTALAASATRSTDTAAEDRAYWETVRDSGNSADLDAYLQRFPHGAYVGDANARLEKLKAPAPAPAEPPPAEETPSPPTLHWGLAMFQRERTEAYRVSKAQYQPLPEGAAVAVYSSAAEVKGSFEVIATLAHANPCKFHRCNIKDAIEPLSAKAREVGANAIIIDDSQRHATSLMSTGITVQARAIRLAEK